MLLNSLRIPDIAIKIAPLSMRICIAPLLFLAATAAPAQNALIRGFVSADLLHAWCTRDTPIDVEACYSYLRGVFDTLNALHHGADDDNGKRVSAVRCIPTRVAVAELRTKYVRHVTANPDSGERQAADLLMDILQDSYEC